MFNGAQSAKEDSEDYQRSALAARNNDMTVRDFFAAQCMVAAWERAGQCKEYELRAMFGDRIGIRRVEAAAKLAYEFADAMIEAR